MCLVVAAGLALAPEVTFHSTEAHAKPQTAPTGASDDGALSMSFAEVVNIRVPEYRSLTGQYRIGADGTVALPGIGRLNVSNLSVTDFERYLKSEIYRLSNREANVAIEISLYRSVYVSGAVIRSGAFPWKPGFSVLHAQALAGGLARRQVPMQLAANPNQQQNPLIAGQQKQRAHRAVYDLAVALATIERLKTERKRGTVFVSPKRVAELIGGRELERLATRQQSLLESRKAAFDNRVRALMNANTMAVSEKNALEVQRVRINQQLSSRKVLRKRIERMARQGYSRADRVFEEQVRIAMLEERLTTTTLAISRMAMAEATAKQDLEALIRAREAEIDLELLNLEQNVAQLAIQLDTKGQGVNAILEGGTGNVVPTGTTPEAAPVYEIVRVVSGKTIVLPANRTTALEPGDVLIVSTTS